MLCRHLPPHDVFLTSFHPGGCSKVRNYTSWMLSRLERIVLVALPRVVGLQLAWVIRQPGWSSQLHLDTYGHQALYMSS